MKARIAGGDTLAHRQQVLESVSFNTPRQKPTNFGLDPTRQMVWTVNDGNAIATTTTTIAINNAWINPLTINIAGVNAPLAITAPSSVLAQQGLASAAANVSIADADAVSANETITATLVDTNGLLSANIGAPNGGGSISGAGSKSLSITGTLAQVNADLTTLSDQDSALSADTITVNTDDGRGGSALQQSVAVNVLTVAISGNAIEGSTLTANLSPVDNTVSYQWMENDGTDGTYQNIGGATGPTYVVTEADEGYNIEVVATVTNDNGVWHSEAAFQPGAQGAAADLVNGKLYVFDGVQNGVASSALSIYDPATNTWTNSSTSDVVARSFLASAVAPTEKIYLIGGLVNGAPTNAVSVYDPSDGTITTTLPNYPIALYGAGAAFGSNSKLYVCGGASSTGTLNAVEVYDPATNVWTTTGSLITAVSNAAVVSYGGKIYAFGGIDGNGAASTAVQIYSPTTGAWVSGTPLPTACYGATAGVIAGKIVVAGGYNSSGQPLDTTQIFDPATNNSTTGPSMPISDAYAGQGLISDGAQMFMVGGTNPSALERLSAGSVTATSNAVGPVLDAAPMVTPPTISGIAQEGQTLTASAIAGQSDNTISYQWMENNGTDGTYQNISGAAASTYLVTEADEGFNIEVVATVTNDNGVAASAASAPTTVVLDSAPTVTTPMIFGTPQPGQILTASATAGQSDSTINYQWMENDGTGGTYQNIGGATGPTYVVTEADEGYNIEVVATVTNDNGVWHSEAAFQPGAQGAAADLVNGKLYVFDGVQNGVASSALSIYDPATNTWTNSSTSDVVARSFLASAVAPTEKIYLIGGLVNGAPTNAVSVYDPSDGTITTTLPNYPIALYGAGAAFGSNSKLYVCGGASSTGTLNAVEVYDPATNVWTTTGSLITAVSNAAVVSYGGKIYAFGGIDGNGAASTAVQIYSPTTGAWVSGTPLPTACYGATAGVIAGKIVVAGGYNSSGQPLEPIREVWIHGEGFAASRLSMMRIMARRMNAATVVV